MAPRCTFSPDGRLITIIVAILSVAHAESIAYAMYHDVRETDISNVSAGIGLFPSFNSTLWFSPVTGDYRLDAYYPKGSLNQYPVPSWVFHQFTGIEVTQVGTRQAKFRLAQCTAFLSFFDIKSSSQVKYVNTSLVKNLAAISNPSRPPIYLITKVTGVTRTSLSLTDSFYYNHECGILVQYSNPAPDFIGYDDHHVLVGGGTVFWVRIDPFLNKLVTILNASALLLRRDFCGYLCKPQNPLLQISEDPEVYPLSLGQKVDNIGVCYWNPFFYYSCSSEISGSLTQASLAIARGSYTQNIGPYDTTTLKVVIDGFIMAFSSLKQMEAYLLIKNAERQYVSTIDAKLSVFRSSLTNYLQAGFQVETRKVIQQELEGNGSLSELGSIDVKKLKTLVYLGVVAFGFFLCFSLIILIAMVVTMCTPMKEDSSPQAREEMGSL